MHWCGTRGLTARPLALVGYGEEDAENALPDAAPESEGAGA